jgi:hypothetical protein
MPPKVKRVSENRKPLPLPDKSIPASIAIIGTFEIAVGLLGLIIIFLAGHMDAATLALLVLSLIYAAMGAGLWAIQEWARVSNVALHIMAIPYALYTGLLLDGPSPAPQIIIAGGIIFVLTRPKIRHKFQTVVPKSDKRH